MENVKDWLKDNPENSDTGDGAGYGYGNGAGYGSDAGDGNGAGYGAGNGSGYGYGDGAGDGYGDGSGDGAGDGSGDGYDAGDGYGYGYGDGYGDGSGYGGLAAIDGKEVFMIDKVSTIITKVKGDVAKGFILNNDLTQTPCFVVKGQGYFAHGETLRAAIESLRTKIFENMDSDEAIEAFMDKFKKGEKYKGTEFFEWHHYLTGSCLMGRESFVKNKGVDLENTYTVEEFIEICENDYGGDIIKELKEKWER